nr:hypothetical protein [uncultured Cardiobacterium sp.]
MGFSGGALSGALSRRGFVYGNLLPLAAEAVYQQPPSSVVTGPAKRRGYTAKRCGYWACQAAWLLAPPSGAVTGPAKRRRYWHRQAAPLLAPPSGVVTGPAKRRGYRVLPLS